MSKALTLAEQRVRQAWLFLAPMLIALTMVAGWPLARTILFSFTDARLDNPSIWSFVGLSNYAYLFTDELWWRSVVNTLIFTAISVSIETALGLIIALALVHVPLLVTGVYRPSDKIVARRGVYQPAAAAPARSHKASNSSSDVIVFSAA